MSFNMRPDLEDEKVKAYVEQERRGGGNLLGGPRAAPRPRQPQAFVDDGSDFGGTGVSQLAGATGGGPRGLATPDARPAMPAVQPLAGPTNAAPGSAMGLAPRPDPFGRPPPAPGTPRFAAPAGAAAAANTAAPAAGAAGAGAGGASAGGAAAPFLAVVADYLQKQQQAKALKENARHSIQQQRVAELGYPSYGIEAANAKRAAEEIEGGGAMDYILPWTQLLG